MDVHGEKTIIYLMKEAAVYMIAEIAEFWTGPQSLFRLVIEQEPKQSACTTSVKLSRGLRGETSHGTPTR